MERILAAVDFSDCSRHALQLAFELSKEFEASLRVLYVAPEMFRQLKTSQAILPVSQDASRIERELTDLILEEFKGTVDDFARIDKKIREGVEDAEILKEAESWQPELILAGTHSRSRVGRLFLGSISEKLLRRAKVPVLIVPETASTQVKRILAAVSGDDSTAEVLRVAASWRTALRAELIVLHVVDDRLEPAVARVVPTEELVPRLQVLREEIVHRIETELGKAFPEESRPSLTLRVGRPSQEIATAVEETAAEVVIVGAQDKEGRSELGSTASRVAHQSHAAVLLARVVAKPAGPLGEA